jgi:hypothetical protein
MSNLKLIEPINTREQLVNALLTGNKVSIVPSHPNEKLIGTIQSVQREDGSGFSFNVRLYVNNSRAEKRRIGRWVMYTPSQILKTVYIRFPVISG